MGGTFRRKYEIAHMQLRMYVSLFTMHTIKICLHHLFITHIPNTINQIKCYKNAILNSSLLRFYYIYERYVMAVIISHDLLSISIRCSVNNNR